MKNNLEKVIKQIESAAVRGTEDALDTLQIEVKNLSRIDTGKTSESYKTTTNVDSKKSVEGVVGSNEMNAIWEERGTGEYREDGKGRKGGWYFKSPRDGKYYFTRGKRANKPMRRAFVNKKIDAINAIGKAFEEEFK